MKITSKSSKPQMINYIGNQPKSLILKLIDHININVKEEEYEFYIAKYGSIDEILDRMRSDRMLKKKTIYRAIINVILSNSILDNVSRIRREVQSQPRPLHPRIGKLICPEEFKGVSFDFSSLNLDTDPERIAKRVCNFYILRNQKGLNVKNHNLILSGPSGTGKSHFVKYLAQVSGKKLLMASPSSILGQYVGESEKKLHDLFQYAETNDLILFIDEIEGMISSRSGASQSWEVTLVNEFLVRVEEFKGVCVVATNLYENIDDAFLRRFSDKLKFGFIKDNERVPSILNKFTPLLSHENDSSMNSRIVNELKVLTPGDLEAVYKRIVLDNRKFTIQEVFEELMKEIKAKSHVYKSSLGL